jgi:hypothetical protein
MSPQFGRPDVTGALDLNDKAKRAKWAVRCDPDCAFSQPALKNALALWRQYAGNGMPRRSDMTPRVLKPYLAMLALHERVAGPDGTRRYRIRLMGNTLTMVAGAKSGQHYDEFLPPDAVPIWNAMTDAVLAHGGPLRMVIRADEVDKPHLMGELFAAPLLADDGTASVVLTIGRFDAADFGDKLVRAVSEQ